MKAMLAGMGLFQEGHQLDEKTIKKVPKKMIGPSAITERGHGAFEEVTLASQSASDNAAGYVVRKGMHQPN
jgi:hypothetical protein